MYTGYQQEINHFALDPDNDSLVYSFANPLNEPSSTRPTLLAANIPFTNSYSLNNPFPGTPVMNTQQGIITLFNNSVIGLFATCVKVTAFKCSVKVAEIYREYVTTFINNCTLASPAGASNSAPNVVPVFTSGFDTTVCAGDTLRFRLLASDFEGSPSVGVPKHVVISADSAQFGLGFINPNR